jgi:hypothetical protein
MEVESIAVEGPVGGKRMRPLAGMPTASNASHASVLELPSSLLPPPAPSPPQPPLPPQRVCPATRMTSEHVVPEGTVVQGGIAFINVAVAVPAGMRVPTNVTVEWMR